MDHSRVGVKHHSVFVSCENLLGTSPRKREPTNTRHRLTVPRDKARCARYCKYRLPAYEFPSPGGHPVGRNFIPSWTVWKTILHGDL